MHYPTRGLRLVYERHTRQHHRFLTDNALPAWLLLARLATPNVAWLFVAVSLGYFLNYEFLHLSSQRPTSLRFRQSPSAA